MTPRAYRMNATAALSHPSKTEHGNPAWICVRKWNHMSDDAEAVTQALAGRWLAPGVAVVVVENDEDELRAASMMGALLLDADLPI